MSTSSEHTRMKPVLDLARKLDVGENPAPEALFDPGSAGFNIWCTPDDHPDDPEGWNLILDKLIPGNFKKPCGFVASVHWGWNDEDCITHLHLSSSAYELEENLTCRFSAHTTTESKSIYNRPVDISWAKSKIEWLFEQAAKPCLDIEVEVEEHK